MRECESHAKGRMLAKRAHRSLIWRTIVLFPDSPGPSIKVLYVDLKKGGKRETRWVVGKSARVDGDNVAVWFGSACLIGAGLRAGMEDTQHSRKLLLCPSQFLLDQLVPRRIELFARRRCATHSSLEDIVFVRSRSVGRDEGGKEG